MKRLVWDIHQLLIELRSVVDEDTSPSTLRNDDDNFKCRKEASISFGKSYTKENGSDSRCLFTFRRVFRRLDRTIQQLEKEITQTFADEEDEKGFRQGEQVSTDKDGYSGEERIAFRLGFEEQNDRSHLFQVGRNYDDVTSTGNITDDKYSKRKRESFQSIRKNLEDDMLYILTKMPLSEHDESTFGLAVSVLETTIRVWIKMSHGKEGSVGTWRKKCANICAKLWSRESGSRKYNCEPEYTLSTVARKINMNVCFIIIMTTRSHSVSFL